MAAPRDVMAAGWAPASESGVLAAAEAVAALPEFERLSIVLAAVCFGCCCDELTQPAPSRQANDSSNRPLPADAFNAFANERMERIARSQKCVLAESVPS